MVPFSVACPVPFSGKCKFKLIVVGLPKSNVLLGEGSFRGEARER